MELYARYQSYQHDDAMACDAQGYLEMFDHPNVSVRHLEFRLNGKLIGVSIVDVTPHSFSSVYFYFDPDYKTRSLGTYSALMEIDEAIHQKKSVWYLGYTVLSCQKMAYKTKFQPQEILRHQQWSQVDLRTEMSPS
jgi:arginine-tRNA-protein transferase